MLDIYFVPPSCRAMPRDPRGLVHAGSIDFDAHRSLAAVLDQCRQTGANLTYFDDSLLRPEQVVTMQRVFDANSRGGQGGTRAGGATGGAAVVDAREHRSLQGDCGAGRARLGRGGVAAYVPLKACHGSDALGRLS